MVAWAACQSPDGRGFVPTEWNLATGTTVPSAWTTVTNPSAQQGNAAGTVDTTVSGSDCQVFWSASAPATGGQFGDAASAGPFSDPSAAPWSGQISNPDYSTFNWGDDPTIVAGASNASVSGEEIGNFLSNLHGTSNASAMATSFIFLLSSTVVMIIFMILGLAVIISKLGLLLSMSVMPLALLLALMPGGSGTGKFGAYAKHLFGLILFACSAGILLSFIAIITGMLADIGVAAAGQGSLFALIWVAISPVTAIWICNLFFKRILKAPSPFKPSAALGYGAALGGFGGGLAGADVFSHLRNRGGQAYSVARGRMSGKQGRSGPGQRGRGRQSMGGRGPGTGGQSGVSPSGVGPTGMSGAVAAGVGAAGVATGATSQSMFGKRQRRRETDQEQRDANQHARSERLDRQSARFEQIKTAAANPGSVVDALKGRISDNAKRVADRFNQKDEDGNPRGRGSLMTAGAIASSGAAGVRRLPRIAKYGAVGLGGVAALGLGAPVLGAVAAGYVAKKALRMNRDRPLRQAENLQNYQAHQKEQADLAETKDKLLKESDARVKDDSDRAAGHAANRAARDDAQAKSEAERRQYVAALRDWNRGNVRPVTHHLSNDSHTDGPRLGDQP
jgi:hypothetical protein